MISLNCLNVYALSFYLTKMKSSALQGTVSEPWGVTSSTSQWSSYRNIKQLYITGCVGGKGGGDGSSRIIFPHLHLEFKVEPFLLKAESTPNSNFHTETWAVKSSISLHHSYWTKVAQLGPRRCVFNNSLKKQNAKDKHIPQCGWTWMGKYWWIAYCVTGDILERWQ